MKKNREVTYACPHCGRTWIAPTKGKGHHSGWTGFLASNVMTHRSKCVHRTPLERRVAAAHDERRWQQHPPKHTVVFNDYAHPGMIDPISEEEQTRRLAIVGVLTRHATVQDGFVSAWAARWLARFHEATTIAEQNAVWAEFDADLARLQDNILLAGKMLQDWATGVADAIIDTMQTFGMVMQPVFDKVAEMAQSTGFAALVEAMRQEQTSQADAFTPDWARYPAARWWAVDANDEAHFYGASDFYPDGPMRDDEEWLVPPDAYVWPDNDPHPSMPWQESLRERPDEGGTP